MSTVSGGRPGRPAAASREEVLRMAQRRFLKSERVDLQAIARELGLARATVHRWFGTREAMLGEMLAQLAEARLTALRAEVGGRGGVALLETFDRYNAELAATPGLGALLAAEQERGLRVLTSSGGVVQPRMVATLRAMIEEEMRAGALRSRVAPETLAYAIVRLAESFIYNDARFGIRGDTARLREIEAALLGVDI